MLNNITINDHVAVRLYDNNTYGTTYGKGKYRRALYNGTAEVMALRETYLLDFHTHEDWVNLARSDEDMEIVRSIEAERDTLYSWVKHYNRATKTKTSTPGFCCLQTITLELRMGVYDERHGVMNNWHLVARPCRPARAGCSGPQLLATNTDLCVA